MKKIYLKTQQRSKKPTQISTKYNSSLNTPQNARHLNAPKDNQSPQKLQGEAKHIIKKPQFWKNIIKPNNEEKKRQPVYLLQQKQKQETKEEEQKSMKNIKRQLRQTIKNDSSEYQKLNDKLNYLQTKIIDMSYTLDKKRQEKLLFLDNQKKERYKNLQTKTTEQNKNKLKQSFRQYVTQVSQQKQYMPIAFNPYSPRNNIYYVSQIIKFYKDQKSSIREHLLTSAQYLKIFSLRKTPTNQQIKTKAVKLTKKNTHIDKKTVVFDLDQTLIHCNDTVDVPHDVKIKIIFPNGQNIDAGINIRPYAVQLIKNLSKNFEVIVFTASHSCYANVVLDYLDPNNEYIHHRLFREHCYITSDNVHVKDLRILNRDLSQVLLIDNAAYSYAYQIDNGIPILPYFKGKNDYQLRALQTYIESMIFQKDVREINRKTFKLHKYQQFDNIDNLVKSLYGQFS